MHLLRTSFSTDKQCKHSGRYGGGTECLLLDCISRKADIAIYPKVQCMLSEPLLHASGLAMLKAKLDAEAARKTVRED